MWLIILLVVGAHGFTTIGSMKCDSDVLNPGTQCVGLDQQRHATNYRDYWSAMDKIRDILRELEIKSDDHYYAMKLSLKFEHVLEKLEQVERAMKYSKIIEIEERLYPSEWDGWLTEEVILMNAKDKKFWDNMKNDVYSVRQEQYSIRGKEIMDDFMLNVFEAETRLRDVNVYNEWHEKHIEK
jgi:hypothetical protein